MPPTSDPTRAADGAGRLARELRAVALRHPATRQATGVHAIYRSAGGGLLASGLSYSALFALVPTLALVAVGLFLLVDDRTLRDDALRVAVDAFPALKDVAAPAIDGAIRHAALGSVVALIGFAWAASGMYLNLTRAMEQFFPGERVSSALARALGVVLVVLLIVGVLGAVTVAGFVTVVAGALSVDAELLLALASLAITLAIASALSYGCYRLLPAAPPTAAAAWLPALLVGLAIGLLTLCYGLLSPWLVSGYQAFGVMASVFVALVWLRLVFIAITYGAAMARFRDRAGARADGTAG
ncbi:MAG: YhjD/YihY/BrkB family envelope integrity protein [Chloroflexota bacterium]